MPRLTMPQITKQVIRDTRILMPPVQDILLRNRENPREGCKKVKQWLLDNETTIQQELSLPDWKAPFNIEYHDDPNSFFQVMQTFYRKVLKSTPLETIDKYLESFKKIGVAAFANTTPNNTTQVSGHLFIPKKIEINTGITAENCSIHEILHLIQNTILYAILGKNNVRNYEQEFQLRNVQGNVMRLIQNRVDFELSEKIQSKRLNTSKIRRLEIAMKAFQELEEYGCLKRPHKDIAHLTTEELYRLKDSALRELQAYGNGFLTGQRVDFMDSIMDDINIPLYGTYLKIVNQSIDIQGGKMSEEQIKNIRKYGTIHEPTY
jgi:hypothetical protein